MKTIQKSLITLIGGLLVLIGLVFVIIPGPSLLLIIPGLILLSIEYPLAKVWLRKCMRWARTMAVWLDNKMRQRSYR